MAYLTLYPFRSNVGNKDANPKKPFSLYTAIHIVMWVILMAGTRTESSDCPMECKCLGTFVDCSKQGLTKVPRDLPDWMETL
jgi:hypothetical protein